MGVAGSVWWDQNLDVSSLILKEHLSISPWRLLTSSSSKEPLLLNELLIVKTGLVITL
uniref:Cytoplasmic dynein light chain n=1 Tax=Solanum tuberosum TaxID=4113 RepID=M0ZRI8_SOLTU